MNAAARELSDQARRLNRQNNDRQKKREGEGKKERTLIAAARIVWRSGKACQKSRARRGGNSEQKRTRTKRRGTARGKKNPIKVPVTTEHFPNLPDIRRQGNVADAFLRPIGNIEDAQRPANVSVCESEGDNERENNDLRRAKPDDVGHHQEVIVPSARATTASLMQWSSRPKA